jgi:ribosomal protein S18 acetylase RimI-like enzyme
MDLVIRPLRQDDAQAYIALRLRGLAEHAEAFTSSAEEEARKPPSAFATRLAGTPERPHDVVLGAFVGDALVGIVGMDVDPRAKVRHRAHVFGMYVPEEHAGRGIGRALLGALVARATGAGLSQLVLTVTATNDAARTLYERAGFVAFGREPEAVVVNGVRHDKLHMIRFLGARASARPPSTNEVNA